MFQYKAALLAIRNKFNPVISAVKLTQQWIFDSYLQVEANTLPFIKTHERNLRFELYQGLADYMENEAANFGRRLGVPMILPSSFKGSPRNMKGRCADTMSIFAIYGSPDLFITFTAKTKWPEIAKTFQRYEQFDGVINGLMVNKFPQHDHFITLQ